MTWLYQWSSAYRQVLHKSERLEKTTAEALARAIRAEERMELMKETNQALRGELHACHAISDALSLRILGRKLFDPLPATAENADMEPLPKRKLQASDIQRTAEINFDRELEYVRANSNS